MKVYSFLELPNEIVDEFYEKFCQPKGYEIVKDFYAQPFKPELITELFEGFTPFVNYYGYVFYNHKDGSGIQLKVNNPRTLDDFINDCQRAGIILEWREK